MVDVLVVVVIVVVVVVVVVAVVIVVVLVVGVGLQATVPVIKINNDTECNRHIILLLLKAFLAENNDFDNILHQFYLSNQ